MERSIYTLQLQLHDHTAAPVLHMKRRDTARRLCIHLCDGAVPYTIAPGCYAMLTAKNARGEAIFEDCTIGENTILYDVSAAATDAPGELVCQLRLYGKPETEGAPAQLLSSPRFTIVVADTVCGDDAQDSLQVQQNALDALIGSALAATENANDAAEALRAAAANGEFNGEKGEKGEKGDKGDDGAPPIIATARGEAFTITDSASRPVQALVLYGKTTQTAVPTPTAPAPLVSSGGSGSFYVTVGAQTLAVATPNGLPGIAVTSGGNYTDEAGQQWLCDEIDLARGVYVKRIEKRTFSTKTGWDVAFVSSSGLYRFYTTIPNGQPNDSAVLCNLAKGVSFNNRSFSTDGICFMYAAENTFAVMTSAAATLDEWGALLAQTPMELLFAAETPTETALENLPDFTALRTADPATTVTADGGVAVSYVADTKRFILNMLQ